MAELSDFRLDADGEPAAPRRPDRPAGYGGVRSPQQTVLAVDQSLSRTGWAIMRGDDRIEVLTTGTEITKPRGKAGLRDSYRRGLDLYPTFRRLIVKAQRLADAAGDGFVLVHELPAVGPRKSTKAEGAHITVTALHIAAREEGVQQVEIYNAQHVKKWITGNVKAEKSEVREHAIAILGTDGSGWPYRNADVFDAIALGITHLTKEH